MAKKVLKQYSGRLSLTQIAEGMDAAGQNGVRLAQDAEILLKAGRFPSAASLAILSIEELGKVSILRSLVTANSDYEVKEAWLRYRRHTEKNFLALIPDLAAGGARSLRQVGVCLTEESLDVRQAYDVVKQLGFYSDCCGAVHWSLPAEIVDENLASRLVLTALAITKAITPNRVEELRLWAVHMKSGLNRMNLLNWAEAMVLSGLQPSGYVEEMRRFTEEM